MAIGSMSHLNLYSELFTVPRNKPLRFISIITQTNNVLEILFKFTLVLSQLSPTRARGGAESPKNGLKCSSGLKSSNLSFLAPRPMSRPI